MVLFTVGLGRKPRFFFEEEGEAAVVFKSHTGGDLLQRKVGLHQQVFRLFQPLVQDISLGRDAEPRFEDIAEPVGTVARGGGNLLQIDVGHVILIDVGERVGNGVVYGDGIGAVGDAQDMDNDFAEVSGARIGAQRGGYLCGV